VRDISHRQGASDRTLPLACLVGRGKAEGTPVPDLGAGRCWCRPIERQGAIDRGYPPRATARTDFGFYTPLFSGRWVELHKVQGLGMYLRLLMEELLSVLGRSCSNFEELFNNSK
jgi:hypothetical protein